MSTASLNNARFEAVSADEPELAEAEVRARMEEMHAFLQLILRRLLRRGLSLVAFGPIVFFLTCLDWMSDSVFLIVLGLLLIWGAWVQKTFVADLETFFRDAGHYPHLVEALTNMKNGHRLLGVIPVGIPVWLWKLATTIIEVVDPGMDGRQVGRAFDMKEEKQKIFKQSWSHICSAGGWFRLLCPGYWGLAWTLFFLYAFTFTIPLGIPILLASNWVNLPPKIDLMFSEEQSLDLKFAALRRYWWMALATVANGCGMPMFAFAFQQLSRAECKELGSGEWGFFQFVTFLTRIVFEASPMFWFQNSLLSLSWDDSPAFTNVIAVLSVFTSVKCIAETTGGMLYELCTGMGPIAYAGQWVAFWKGQVLREDMDDGEIEQIIGGIKEMGRSQTSIYVRFGYFSSVIVAIIALAGLLRLWGVTACDSHILNLRSMQIENPLAGCFAYNSTNTSRI